MQYSTEFEQMHAKIVIDKDKKDSKYGWTEEDYIFKNQVRYFFS